MGSKLVESELEGVELAMRPGQKHLRITIKGERILISGPKGCSQKELLDFAKKHKSWILEKRSEIKQRLTQLERFLATKTEEMLIQGSWISIKDLGRDLSASEKQNYVRTRAKVYLKKRTFELAEKHGFVFKAVKIRDQKTRWGSCSTQGNINLSWRLFLMPEWVSDYIIIHELCHLAEANHSKRFWTLVEKHCPIFSQAEAWLKSQDAKLVKAWLCSR